MTFPLRTSVTYTFVTLGINLFSSVDCVTWEKCTGLYYVEEKAGEKYAGKFHTVEKYTD